MSINQYKGNFFDTFGMLRDIRQEGKVWHDLIDVLFIIVSAAFCKIDEIEGIYIWANADINKEWLKKYVYLRNGIPSISTFRRVLNAIDPKQFEKCFIAWTKEMTVFSEEGGDIVAIDGKTMRGSRDGEKITHIVSAWCNVNNLVLGQVKTNEKSNEITAIPDLLDLLYLEGCIITIDAMGCQTKIVEKILKKKADYVISLKGNQETLHNEVIAYYEDLKEDIADIEQGKKAGIEYAKTMDKGHGRIEERRYYYSTDIDWMVDAKKDWKGLSGIGMVYRKITQKDKVTEETQYFIGSIRNINDFKKAVRGHWGIESVHWSLDVTFKDDANKTRKDYAPENLAVAKRIVLNMVRNEKELYPKLSANMKRLTASLDVEYRTKVFDLNFKSKLQ
ncbi:MAG: ISAs1 family transposase [Firmicutes bacterium]|nr:ISAs1 family transposase [Bacillota bacterium]